MKGKIIIFVGFTLFLTVSGYGQKKKSVTQSRNQTAVSCQQTESPKLRGFFLGQTVEEINDIIPNFKDAYNTERERNSVFSTSDYSANLTEGKEIGLVQFGSDYPFPDESGEPLKFSKDEDINQFEWFFYKNKLYAFSLYYEEYDPPTAQSFAKQVSEKLNLPTKGWVAQDKSDIGAVLTCNGFKVNVHTAYRNFAHITITDTSVESEIISLEKEIKQRKKKEEQDQIRREREKKEIFKP